MAYLAFNARLAHDAPKTRRAPTRLYALFGSATAALAFAGWGVWMVNDVVPGAIQGMVLVFGAA